MTKVAQQLRTAFLSDTLYSHRGLKVTKGHDGIGPETHLHVHDSLIAKRILHGSSAPEGEKVDLIIHPGDRTVTIKNRLNAILPEGVRVYETGGEWFLSGLTPRPYKLEDDWLDISALERFKTAYLCNDISKVHPRNFTDVVAETWGVHLRETSTRLVIRAREWFDKTWGNSYFYCRAWLEREHGDDLKVYETTGDMEYGYGSQYEHVVCAQIQDMGVLPIKEPLWYLRDSYGIRLDTLKLEGLKRDLKKPL